jgi:hypothetical protein
MNAARMAVHGMRLGMMRSWHNEQRNSVPLRDELVKAGWKFGVIHWDNEREGCYPADPPHPAGS